MTERPRVVIIGGGFAGLNAARGLKRAPVDVVLIDAANHHLFQPLLYQVATAALSPAEIASPLRHILARQRNAEVVYGAVDAIDVRERQVFCGSRSWGYDVLVVAAGKTHTWFGHDEWAHHARGLKTIQDAVAIRERFLLSFERAELEEDEAKRKADLTFVVIGGGPTGVELAGAMAEIARRSTPRDFRRIDTTSSRVILVEAGGRLLPSFPERLSERTRRDLEALGVQVWLNTKVTAITARGVELGEDQISTPNVFWAAGVRGVELGEALGVALSRDGRVMVKEDLSIEGHPEVFVIGDLASVKQKDGEEVPGVSPAAIQMGRYVARLIAREAHQGAGARQAFRYRDKGQMTTIGRARAVADLGWLRCGGRLAWWLWLGVHIVFLIGFRNQLIVLIQWAWAYIRFERGSRLISRRADEVFTPNQPGASAGRQQERGDDA